MYGRRPEPDIEIPGDYDAYGMPSPGLGGSQRGSGLVGRLRKFGSTTSVGGGFDAENDDGDDGVVGADNQFPDVSLRDLAAGLRDRHRYPGARTPEAGRTMSMTSNSTYDTTPIIPMLGAASPARKKAGVTQNQYRQKMIDSRRALLSSETGLPLPTQQSQNSSRRPSMLSDSFPMGMGRDGPPFAPNLAGVGQGARTMSLGGHPSRMSNMSMHRMSHQSQVPMSPNGPNGMGGVPPHMRRPPAPRNGVAFAEYDALRAKNASLMAEVDHLRTAVSNGGTLDPHARQRSMSDEPNGASANELATQVNELQLENDALHERNRELERDASLLANQLHAGGGGTGSKESPELRAQYEDLKARYDMLLEEHQHNQGTAEKSHQHELAYQGLRQKYENQAASHELLASQVQELQLKHDNLLAKHDDLQAKHDAASRELGDASTAFEELNLRHDDLRAKHDAVSRDLDDSGRTYEDLNLQHNDLQAQHEKLQDQHASVAAQHADLQREHLQLQDSSAYDRSLASEASTSQAQADSDLEHTVSDLLFLNTQLREEVHRLSVELAEAARRELGLAGSADAPSPTATIADLQKQLNIEREKRLMAEHRNPVSDKQYDMAELKHHHNEATQLLEIRSQQYNMAQDKLRTLEKDIRDAHEQNALLESQAKVAKDNTAVNAETRQLKEHLRMVEDENLKMQHMLDQISDRAPLSERLKSVEDQRNVLQEALRSIRERKDQEIRMLHDRLEEVEAKFEKERHRSASANMYPRGAGNRVGSELSIDTQLSQDSMNHHAYESSEEPLEVPRLRHNRPASPLHLNFKLRGDYFGESPRARSDSRTSPLPLALGS